MHAARSFAGWITEPAPLPATGWITYHMPEGLTSVAITYIACPSTTTTTTATTTTTSAAAAGIQLEAFTAPGCRSPQGLTLASGPSAVAPDKCWQLETRVADFATSVGCLPTYVNITLPGR